MRVLIMGCGRVGSTLAIALEESGHDVTVIDTNEGQFSRLPADFKGTSIVGNGTDTDTLRKASIEQMDAFIAVTQGDNRNLMAAQIAKQIFSVPHAICRVYDPIRGELYESLGITTISSTNIMSRIIKEQLEQV